MDIDGHELIRKDRNRKGGGVAMFVRSSINYKFRLDLMPENLEIIVVEVLKLRAKSFLINTWYSPPDASLQVFDDYEKCLRTMDLEELELVCTCRRFQLRLVSSKWQNPEKNVSRTYWDITARTNHQRTNSYNRKFSDSYWPVFHKLTWKYN